jgi:hypothetical protein
MRRIAKTLQAGDVVEEAHNIVRIVGVDACPGLLILGRRNLYLVDGLVQTAQGEVIDAKDAPRDVLTIPGTLAELEGADQQSHRWLVLSSFSLDSFLTETQAIQRDCREQQAGLPVPRCCVSLRLVIFLLIVDGKSLGSSYTSQIRGTSLLFLRIAARGKR